MYVIYQCFALYLRRTPARAKRLPSSYWRLAVVFYAVSAAGNLLVAIPQAGLHVISDPAGVPWKISDITRACALVSIFVMGALALLAWIRLADQDAQGATFPEELRKTNPSRAVL